MVGAKINAPRRSIAAACAAIFVFGCESTPPRGGASSAGGSEELPSTTLAAASATPLGPSPNAAATNNTNVSTEMTLAMADVPGGTAVDGEVRAAQNWVKRLPKSTDKLIELGRAWVLKARHSGDPGYYLNAKACVDLVLEKEPQNHLARELLAQVLNNQHKFLEAKDLCEQVLAKDPESLITLAVLSDVLYEMGRVPEAISTTDKLMELKPDLPSYMRVSFLQWVRGDMKSALRSAKLGIEASNDPDKPEPKAYALVQTANYFFHRGDYEGADEGYKKAASTLSDYPPALVGRGRVAMAKGDFKRAAELFLMAYKELPLAETAWRLGDARTALGDNVGAEEAHGWVIKIGKNGDARTLSQFYSTKNRDVDEALRLAEEEIKNRPGIITQDTHAWALYRKGSYKEARIAIDKALQYGTKDASLLYHSGAIRIALGEKDEGTKLIKEALALNPKFDFTGATEAEALLQK